MTASTDTDDIVTIGDRVQLTDAQANSKMKRRHRVDWLTRRGTVTAVATYVNVVYVRWDGNHSEDRWPPAALTRIGRR